METIPLFTVSDITALREAKEVLCGIDCVSISCDVCPLYLKHRGCLINYLDSIAREAEIERSKYYGT